MLTYLYVALGGAIGSVSRYGAASFIDKGLDAVFPWGTVIVNVTGCFLIGLFAAMTGPGGRYTVPQDGKLFFMVGICGGYTTFSSFSLQTLTLARDGDMMRAGLNVVASVVLCLVAVWLGWLAGTSLNTMKGA